jgi:hypothetical protein
LRVLSHDGGSFGFGTTLFLLPDTGVGIVILTNVRNGSDKEQLPFNAAVLRRIVEALFAEARPLAGRQLAYYESLRASVPRQPQDRDHEWLKTLVGVYHNDALGRVTLRAIDGGAEIDAGEWRSVVERVVDGDGNARLVLLDPPFAGGAILVGRETPPTLFIPGQTSYRFRRE